MKYSHFIQTGGLTIKEVKSIIQNKGLLGISDEANSKIIKCREYLDLRLAKSHELIYGINTGFGSLSDVEIPKDQIETLQKNLVMSHACGIGDKVPKEIIKLMLLFKIQSLSYGYSGISIDTVERLLFFYNENLLPVIYEQGSLGASGDLAPLAHLSLPLLGLGEIYYDQSTRNSDIIQKDYGIAPLHLKSKEGLALLNGTQFMSAYGIHILIQAQKLLDVADLIGGLSVDAYDGKPEPFENILHQIRNHTGQIDSASNIRAVLKGSPIFNQQKNHVQDPYSFRCIPQVHGASRDAINYATGIFENEISGVTDNPIIFPDEDRILSGGNFHGQPLAITLDFLGLALAELGSISERRTFCMVAGKRGLPPFLIKNPGLNSGFMIPQYTAASIASQNKQLTMPASSDSITSSNGQEDHVSMGANAATKCLRILNNLKRILAIEMFTSLQALEFRDQKSSPIIESIKEKYRESVNFLDDDRELYPDIAKSIKFIDELEIDEIMDRQ